MTDTASVPDVLWSPLEFEWCVAQEFFNVIGHPAPAFISSRVTLVDKKRNDAIQKAIVANSSPVWQTALYQYSKALQIVPKRSAPLMDVSEDTVMALESVGKATRTKDKDSMAGVTLLLPTLASSLSLDHKTQVDAHATFAIDAATIARFPDMPMIGECTFLLANGTRLIQYHVADVLKTNTSITDTELEQTFRRLCESESMQILFDNSRLAFDCISLAINTGIS